MNAQPPTSSHHNHTPFNGVLVNYLNINFMCDLHISKHSIQRDSMLLRTRQSLPANMPFLVTGIRF